MEKIYKIVKKNSVPFYPGDFNANFSHISKHRGFHTLGFLMKEQAGLCFFRSILW